MRTLSRRLALGLLASAAGIGIRPLQALAAQKMEVSQYGQFMGGFPWIVAWKKGFLKEEGLDIDGFISSAGGGTSVRNLLASGLPFGEVASGAAIAAIKEGVPLMLVYAATNNIGEIAWMSRPDNPINSINDLAGHTVGYTAPKSTTEMALRMSLQNAGVPTDKIKFVSTGGLGGALSMLKGGNIDAAPFVDPTLTASGKDFKIVFRAAEHMPPIHFSFGVANPEFAAKNPDMVRKMISARRRAVDWLYAHPDEGVDFCAQYLEIDKALGAQVLPKFIAGKYWSPGSFSQEGLDSNVIGLHLLGALEGTIDWGKHVEQKYLPDDLRTKLAS
jgi:NitT/TauT family transport system substrate-binding protein